MTNRIAHPSTLGWLGFLGILGFTTPWLFGFLGFFGFFAPKFRARRHSAPQKTPRQRVYSLLYRIRTRYGSLGRPDKPQGFCPVFIFIKTTPISAETGASES